MGAAGGIVLLSRVVDKPVLFRQGARLAFFLSSCFESTAFVVEGAKS